jgi:hypothetical protein
MEKSLRHLVAISLLGFAAASCSQAPKTQAPPPQAKAAETPYRARGEAAAFQVSATVEAVDVERRLITLKGQQSGNVGQYKVGVQVKRLSEIKVGDTITAEYQVGAVAELREPTAEEKSAPLAVAESTERATSAVPPAAALVRAIRVVTTIDQLDRTAQSLTIKGPLGGIVTLPVHDPAAFERLKIGQSIVVTFAETLLLSVDPAAKKA